MHQRSLLEYQNLRGIFVATFFSFTALQPIEPGRQDFTSTVYSWAKRSPPIVHCRGSTETFVIVHDCATVPPFTCALKSLIPGFPGGATTITVKPVSVMFPKVTSLGAVIFDHYYFMECDIVVTVQTLNYLRATCSPFLS